MKNYYYSVFTFFLIVFIVTSCQRELYYGVSIGVLKSNDSSKCYPITVGGDYKLDSALTEKNFLDVLTDVSLPITYKIYSDTVNGYYFYQSGNVNRGINKIHLLSFGKPIKYGTDTFTLHYGESKCNLNITVPVPAPAVFTLVGSPNLCSDIYVSGVYVANTPLNSSNTITVKALVTTLGSYKINATTNNNFSFSDSGIFSASGMQNVELKGTGTPLHGGSTKVVVSNIISTCNLGVIVLDSVDDGKAFYTLDCSNFITTGGYYAGIKMNATNSITITVNVTKLGAYTIYTNPANGVTFGSTGSFSHLGTQSVTLTSSGTPITAGLIDFIANTGGASHCNFSLNMLPLPPPATFSLSGSPNACLPINVNGFYIHSKPLDAANTITTEVNVTAIGSYVISTNAANGISFTGSGVFTNTGIQSVVLQGNGTPLNAGSNTFTVSANSSSCTFTVPVL